MNEFQTHPMDSEAPVSQERKTDKKNQNIAAKLVTGVLVTLGLVNAAAGRNPDNGSRIDDGKVPAGQPTQTPTFEAYGAPEPPTPTVEAPPTE